MSDPLLQASPTGAADPADQEKEARIEQLLLAGLDSYFAGDYEQAINIWTRVAFLERGHTRARAYIDRARGALAERHRQSDELLHQGLAAFNHGDGDAARELIMRAVEQGAPQDVALVLLERLNRLGPPGTPVEVPTPLNARRQVAARGTAERAGSGWWLRATALIAAVAAGAAVAVLSGLPVPDWLADPAGNPREPLAVRAPEPLPIARASERVIARARSLLAGGRHRDALRALETIGMTDPLRPQADRLRADVQRRLLSAPGGATR